MQKFLQKWKAWLEDRKNQEGVTLIELLAVVVILAIIAAIAVPVVIGQINNSKVKTDISNESIIIDAIQRSEFDYQSQFSGQMSLPLTGLLTGTTTGTNPSGTLTVATVTGGTEAYVLGSDSTANLPVSSSVSPAPMTLNQVITSGLPVNGTGSYLNSIPAPQRGTGSSWTIIQTAGASIGKITPAITLPSPVTANIPASVLSSKDYTQFTLPDPSGTGNDTYYIYPTSNS